MRRILNGLVILALVTGFIGIIFFLYADYGWWGFIPIPIIITSYVIGSKFDIITYMENLDNKNEEKTN